VESAGRHFAPQQLVAVQLTGMGNDGAEAMAALHRRGVRTIAEAESTAIVWGMPQELVRLGGATRVLPSHAIADQLLQWAQAR
jgi:two-component system chemotaxis response regulator CheB